LFHLLLEYTRVRIAYVWSHRDEANIVIISRRLPPQPWQELVACLFSTIVDVQDRNDSF